LFNDYNKAYTTLQQDAGYILTENLQDRSVRSGFSLAGWKPRKDMKAQAVEWWQFDWEYAQTPVSLCVDLKRGPKLTLAV
jgi:polyamine oxidase